MANNVTVVGMRATEGKRAPLRVGQKSYALPAAIGSIPAGTVIGVDAAIPDSVLDRLNSLPLMDCLSTCSGGHRPWLLYKGVEKPAPAPKGPKWEYPAVLCGRAAKAMFNLLKTGTEKPAQPGTFTLGDMSEKGGQYLIYVDMPYLWIVAPIEGVPSVEWWEGLCEIVEGAEFKAAKKAKGGLDMDSASAKLVPLFNYDLQVWVIDGVVKVCNHPSWMRREGECCNAWVWAGMTEDEAIAEYEKEATA